MQIITSDKIGCLKYINCINKNIIYEQKSDYDLTREINYLTWSGGFGGYEENEITLCRTNGLIESFKFDINEKDNFIKEDCSISFLTCDNCIYTKMLNNHHNIIYEDLCNIDKIRYKNYENFFPIYNKKKTENGVYEDYLLNDRLLVSVNNNGIVHVLNWSSDIDNKYILNEYDKKMYENDEEKMLNVYFDKYQKNVLNNINFKIIENENINKRYYENINIHNIFKKHHFNNLLSKKNILQSYILSYPINAACVNDLLTNRLAIGGYKNYVKIFDLFTGSYLWKSDGLGQSMLHFKCETLIKSINFLNDINVNVLCVGTYDQKILLYDIRCQRKPVHMYDHFKIKNVTDNEYNCYDTCNYFENDLIFTNIATSKFILSENDIKNIEKEKKYRQKEIYKENENEIKNECEEDEEYHEYNEKEKIDSKYLNKKLEDKFFIKFNIIDLKKKNKEIYDILQKEKLKEHKKKNDKIDNIKKRELKHVNVKYKNKKQKKIINYNKNEDENIEKTITLNNIKRIQNINYFIKKPSQKEYIKLYISDNYGNVYIFKLLTGIKLLKFLYKKKCALKKKNYKKKKKSFLLSQKEKLFKFYKSIQEKNRTHWRNDLKIVMLVKDNTHQFFLSLVKKIRVHLGSISSLNFHKNGKYLCITSYERFVSILDIDTKKVIKKIHAAHIITGSLFITKYIHLNKKKIKKKKNKNILKEKKKKKRYLNK